MRRETAGAHPRGEVTRATGGRTQRQKRSAGTDCRPLDLPSDDGTREQSWLPGNDLG
jgi:hypothetical protein